MDSLELSMNFLVIVKDSFVCVWGGDIGGYCVDYLVL